MKTKKCPECGKEFQARNLQKYCSYSCAPKLKRTELKRSTKEIKRTPINYVRKPTGEGILHDRVWKSRPHICQNPDCERENFPRNPHCFAHICNKWTYPELRLFENNIFLVCSIDCHNEIDRLVGKAKPILARHISSWKTIDINKIQDYV